MRSFVATLLLALMVSSCGLLMPVQAQMNEHPNCAGWISASCCCTNNCCFEVAPGTVEAIGDDLYRVIASGQVLKRTGWSMDGRFMRCACDPIEGQWTVHPAAHTRCIFPPMPNS
jgi:hypothetical protein